MLNTLKLFIYAYIASGIQIKDLWKTANIYRKFYCIDISEEFFYAYFSNLILSLQNVQNAK